MENSGDTICPKPDGIKLHIEKGKVLINRNITVHLNSCLFLHFPSPGFLIGVVLMLCSEIHFA
jgi:hypothetical protein